MALAKFQYEDGTPSPAAVIQQLALITCITRDRRTEAQEILDLCGGGEILAFVHQPTALPPSWMLIRQGTDHYYLMFAGTANIAQWIAHVQGAYGTQYGDTPQYVHEFWNRMWLEIKPQVLALITNWSPDMRLSLSGHSYGASCIQLASFDLVNNLPRQNVELMGLSAPRAITRGYTGRMPSSYVRVHHGRDPMPQLPPSSRSAVNTLLMPAGLRISRPLHWRHYGRAFNITSEGQVIPDRSDPEVGFDPSTIVTEIQTDVHDLDGIWPMYALWWHNVRNTNPGNQIVAIVARILNNSTSQQAGQIIDPRLYINTTNANTVYFAGQGNVITPENLLAMQSVNLITRAVESVLIHNIQELGVINMAAVSGIWKFQYFINNSKYGRSETIYAKDARSFDLVVAWAKKIADERANLFGNSNAVQNTVRKSLGTPIIESVRISDPINRASSQLIRLKPAVKYAGIANGTNSAADHFSTVLAINLRGQNVVDNTLISRSAHLICGSPDTCVSEGEYNADVLLTTTLKHGKALENWIKFLTDQANALGYIGLASTDVKKDITGFVLGDDGNWVATVAAHGYESQDRVRVTGASKAFNRVCKVVKLSDNSVKLIPGPRADATAPEFGKIQRIGKANGQKVLQFYQYMPLLRAFDPASDVTVSTKRLGRENLGVSFHPRAKRGS